jgi:hypothetical protein
MLRCTPVIAVVALGACGGAGSTRAVKSSTSDSSTATTLFIARADAICQRLDAELAAGEPKHLSVRQLASRAPLHAALEQKAVVSLGKLAPPSSLAGDWRQILSLREGLAQALAEVGRDARRGDQPGIQAVATSKKRLHAALFGLASHDGFRYCSQATPATGASSPRGTSS